MKRFRSRLDGLRRLKDQQEQMARTQLAACQRRQADIEQRLRLLNEQMDRISETAGRLLRGPAGAELMAGTLALHRQCQQQQDQLRTALEEARQAVDVARRPWHAARAEHRAVSGRIERQRQEHRRMMLLQEEHAQQETASQKHFQRHAEPVQEVRS